MLLLFFFLGDFTMLIPRNFDKFIANRISGNSSEKTEKSIDISEQANKLGTFIKENPEIVASIIGTLFSCRHIIRSLIVSHRTKRENERKDRTLYDPRTGFHYILKRTLSNADYKYISDRRKEGYDMYDILCSINAI